uniref:Uncharacterized protein n=1 Tax=Oryza punctata TaxID=4537 RepID=A0A0E0KWR4_ORYPU
MAILEVASVHELRRVLWGWDHKKELRIKISTRVSLDEARELWSAVSMANGYARLYNIHVLMAKEDARNLVLQKIHHVQDWIGDVETQVGLLQTEIDALRDTLLGAGPILPLGYQPIIYEGPKAYLDIDQLGEQEHLGEHIVQVRENFTVSSPSAPHPRGLYWNQMEFEKREAADQLCMMDFNVTYLKLKRDSLLALKASLEQGIRDLEKFLSEKSYLGCGNGEYVMFVDVPVCAGDAHASGESSDEDTGEPDEDPDALPNDADPGALAAADEPGSAGESDD